MMKKRLSLLSLAVVLLFNFNLLWSQTNSSTFISCTSGGCVTSSNITLNGVNPGDNPGDPAWIQGGETFEVCYEVTGWNYININWFHAAEPHVGPGMISPDGTTSTSAQGVNQNWIWSSYCNVNCCTLGSQCGTPALGAWLFGVDSDQAICSNATPNDGEISNNWGDSGSSGWEFCLDVETDCGPVTDGVISSDVSWGVYGDTDSGTNNANCGCEGGAIECALGINIVCCDVPDVDGDGASASEIFVGGGICANDITSLFVTGDVTNPDYSYEWVAPFGVGPNSAVWDANSTTPLPIPPPAGSYTLTVFNNASGDCEKAFSVDLFDGGEASAESATACIGSGDVFEIQTTGQSIGGAACNLVGVSCLQADDPQNPYGNPIVVVDPNQLSPSDVGIHDFLVFVGTTGTICFDLAMGTLEILPPPNVPITISAPTSNFCFNQDLDSQLPIYAVSSPQPGLTYEWSLSSTYSPDAIIFSGASFDPEGVLDLDLSGVDPNNLGDLVQSIFVYPINSQGCVGQPASIDLTFENCECIDPSSIVPAFAFLETCYDNLDQIDDFAFGTFIDDNPGSPFITIGEDISFDFGHWTSPTPPQTVYLQVTYNGTDYFQAQTPAVIAGSVFSDFSDFSSDFLSNIQATTDCPSLAADLDLSLWCYVEGVDIAEGPFDAGFFVIDFDPDCLDELSQCVTSFQGNIAFEGYQGANGMSTFYADNNLLPTSQPFNVPPFNYNGAESINFEPPNIVDWVLLELRDANDESLVMDSRAVLVNAQGELMTTSGDLIINFYDLNIGDYFVAIHHLGHISVISDSPLSLPLSAPFTFSSSNVSGINQMKTVGGVDVMIAGDYDNSNTINFSDFVLWLSNNNALNTYASFDADGNGTVNFFDFILWLGNNNHLGYSGI